MLHSLIVPLEMVEAARKLASCHESRSVGSADALDLDRERFIKTLERFLILPEILQNRGDLGLGGADRDGLTDAHVRLPSWEVCWVGGGRFWCLYAQ